MKFIVRLATTMTITAAWSSTACADTNIALGKLATLVGTFGSDSSLSTTVTDGLFLPKDTEWQAGTVWWDGTLFPNNVIEIDLQGTFTINSLVVQADDNDAYLLEYRSSGGVWNVAWQVPNYDFEPFGMQTRPNPNDNSERFALANPVIATALRFSGNLNDGDTAFAVSEIQAYGSLIPEPTSLVILAIAGLHGVMRRPLKRKSMSS